MKGFFTAVSADDREGLKKFLTPKSAEQLLAMKSLRDDLGRWHGVKEIRLAAFPRLIVSATGSKGAATLSFVMEVTDSAGVTRRVASAALAVRTGDDWLLGE